MKLWWFLTLLLIGALLSVAKDVTVVWDPNKENNIGGYKLYLGTNGSRSYDLQVTVNVTNGTSVVIKNVPAGVTHWIALTAYDTNGLESDFSEELSFVVPNKPGKPRVK